ncbi:MAG TPA: PQQ-binding-like beta-propeller repeat protein [Caulobacteraceae bacterium]|nr:PQQ-binding-like beta-propeller repeat protein [Caulobacteraceae bacterium]
MAGLTALVGASALVAAAASAQSPPTPRPLPPGNPGEVIFKARCASCHEPAVGRAPDRARLADLGLLEVYNELKNGSMRPMAEGLSDAQIGAVSAYLAPPPEGAAATALTLAAPSVQPPDPPMCAKPDRFAIRTGDWNGWGRNAANWRFQPTPGFTAAQASRLKVRWSFAFASGKYGQPTIVGGRVFLGGSSGRIYALDARTGCLRWRYDNGAPVRTTISIGRLAAAPSGYAAVFGDFSFGASSHEEVALDAVSGKLIWKQQIESHPLSLLTGAPAIYGGRVYQPISSAEEVTAAAATYRCCTFQGAVVALQLATGKVLWKTHTISTPPAPSHANRAGVQMMGPAGAAIWSAPTIDPKRGLLYVATGDSYTDVGDDGSDSVMAMDLVTGAVRWRTRVTAGDNYMSGCEAAPLVNCPRPLGHDYDFGASPILLTLPGGADILLAGQKSGFVYGLDPATGRLLWKARLGEGGPLGGVEFGMASDGRRLFVGNADAFMPSPPGKPGLFAIDPANGRRLWFSPSPHLACGWTRGSPCLNGISAAPTAISGLVFAGDLNGRLRAYSAADGRVVWEIDTGGRTFGAVNGGPRAGGNIDGPGPVVAGGMLYVMSGYQGSLGGSTANVLLAFSVDGK